jgi:ubiquinone/menaquinone biosynthesis C-methylase UbiE
MGAMCADLDRPSKELAQQRFGQYAQGYVESQTFAAAPELRTLVGMANPQPGGWVLDIATGGGHTALAFVPWVQRAIACDLAHPMLVAARSHARQAAGEHFPRLAFHQADAEFLPYPTACFDLATCRIAPHHFPEVGRFFSECARILKPGGTLLVQDHLLPEDPQARTYIDAFERLRDPSHQGAFSQAGWISLFEGAGFTITHLDRVLKRHAFLPFAQRQGCSPAVIAELAEMMRRAPQAVRQWRDPQGFEGDLSQASFSDWHILIAGRR